MKRNQNRLVGHWQKPTRWL